MGIDLTNFQAVFSWVAANGYPLMFLAMCIEGPTITAAASFALTLGFFNPFIILILSLLGDIIPDILLYGVGKWKGMKFVLRFGHIFGVTKARIEKLEKTVEISGGRTVAALKYTPVIAFPGLMLIGALKMDFRKYMNVVFFVTLQKTLTFMAIGYFFGQAYNIGKYIKYGAMLPFIFIVLYIVVVYFYRRYTEKMAKKIEKI